MEMGRNTIEIRTGSKHYQISRIRPATAVEFHCKQQLPLRNPCRHRATSSQFLHDGVLCQIAVRPLGLRLATAQRIDHRIKSNGIADIFLEPGGPSLVAVSPFHLGSFLVATIDEERGVVVDRLRWNDDIDVCREPLVERCDRPSADEDVRSFGVDDCLQRLQQFGFALSKTHDLRRGSS
jgi:hypothetical protein